MNLDVGGSILEGPSWDKNQVLVILDYSIMETPMLKVLWKQVVELQQTQFPTALSTVVRRSRAERAVGFLR